MKSRINLIPNDQRSPGFFNPEFIPFGIAAAFVVYGSISAAGLHFNRSAKSAALARITHENSELLKRIGEADSIKKIEDLENGRVKSLQDVLARKNHWSTLFKELSILIPGDVWLTVLGSPPSDSAPRTLLLRGEATTQGKMAQFFAALETSKFFKGATITYSEKDSKLSPDLFRFEFSVPYPEFNPGET